MFGWLRDTLTTTSPSLSYRHSMIPSPYFHQQQQQQPNHKKTPILPPSDDDDDEGTDEDSNGNSFYHNPYHSSGQMNYNKVPQQQYTNEHNYPTYLARQQLSDNTTNQSIDDQIYSKLVSLQERASGLQPYAHRQYDYAYRNRMLSTPHSSCISNVNTTERNDTNEKPSEQEDEDEDKEEEEEEEIQRDDDDDNDEEEIRAYYPGQYPNLDENFDLASVVLWYRNVMQSVKKLM
jgi:hypothetical protein